MISINSLQTLSLDHILLGNFTLSNSIILVEDLIRGKRGFEIFLVDHYAADIRKKVSLVSIEKFLYQCHPTYTRWVSLHKVLYLSFLGSYNICIIYLHETEACLKVAIAMFYFRHLKSLSNIMKYIFNYISIYSWRKVSLLTHMRNKCAMREINLYFLTLWKLAKLFLQKFIIFSMITVIKEMGNIRACKDIYLQKFIKFRLSG